MSSEAEIIEPGVLQTPKRRRKLKITDVVFFSALIVVIVILVITIVTKLQLKHDVNGARAISDQVITEIDKQDGSAVRKLGSSKFQATYSAASLTAQFKAIEPSTSEQPSVDRETLYKGSSKVIYIIYKYPPLLADQPFYIRIAITDNQGKWQLTNIAGSANESTL